VQLEANAVAIGIDAAVVANHHIVVRRPDAGGPGHVLEDFVVPPTLAGMETLTKRLSQWPASVAVAEPTSMTWLPLSVALREALRLPTIGAECEKVAKQAAANNADHLSYLLQLLELELLDREKRSAERRLKAARFPTLKTLESFDFAARPSVNKVLIAELARCEYIDKRENILMIGNPGTGKSHLATALAAQACHKGYKVRFFRTTELVTALIEARDERTFLRLKGQLARLDLLVLDELGYVPASKVGAELLFDVISTAYERTSLIVTSNLPFDSWTEVLGSERLTGATLDRLIHRCNIIETKGESYRLQDAKARTRRAKLTTDSSGNQPVDQAQITK
jgi:DNA replication protein DnaC